MSTTPNLYEIPLEELWRLAETAPATIADPVADPAADPAAQPRDENGRFVAVDPVVDPVADPVADPAAPVEEFTATIDVGEGSGVQVFTGATKDELLQKLIAAQENATRKIRDLSRAPVVAVPDTAPVVDLDEEAALAQAIIAEPSTTIRRVMEKELGMTVKEAKEKINAAAELDAINKAQNAGKEFVASTPDYYACPENEARMIKYLTTYKMPNTIESIREAYTELNGSGLLAKKPAVAAPSARARASGLSARDGAPPTIVTPDPIKEAYNMPLDQLFKKAGGFTR